MTEDSWYGYFYQIDFTWSVVVIDFFIHLFLESTVVWMLLGLADAQKEYLASPARKLSFWAVILAAGIPDFDVVVPLAHRLFTHSLVFPLLLALAGIALWATRQSRLTYVTSWAMSFQWAAHLLLDFGSFPPMGLFWPFSSLCFTLSPVMTLENGIPHFDLSGFIFTPYEWMTWGFHVFEGTTWSIQLGVPLLSLLLFLLTVGRDFRPWWTSKIQEDVVMEEEAGLA